MFRYEIDNSDDLGHRSICNPKMQFIDIFDPDASQQAAKPLLI